MNEFNLCGRTGLARILECSENTARSLEKAGLITPIAVVDGRPLFRIDDAMALRAKREAKAAA
jgi:hypothetical protein